MMESCRVTALGWFGGSLRSRPPAYGGLVALPDERRRLRRGWHERRGGAPPGLSKLWSADDVRGLLPPGRAGGGRRPRRVGAPGGLRGMPRLPRPAARLRRPPPPGQRGGHRRRDGGRTGKLRLDRVGLHAMQQEPDFPVRALRGRVEQVAQANVDEQPDDEVAPEVPTSFATKGVGWSGREEDDLEVIELGRPPCPSDVAERSRVQGEEPPEKKSGPGGIGFRLARR